MTAWFLNFRRPTFGRALKIKKDKEEEVASVGGDSEDELIQLHPADKDWAVSVDKNIQTVYKKLKKNGERYVSKAEPSDSIGEDGDMWFKLPGMG